MAIVLNNCHCLGVFFDFLLILIGGCLIGRSYVMEAAYVTGCFSLY